MDLNIEDLNFFTIKWFSNFLGTLDLEDDIEEQEDMILEYVNIVGESTAMSMRLIFQ